MSDQSRNKGSSQHHRKADSADGKRPAHLKNRARRKNHSKSNVEFCSQNNHGNRNTTDQRSSFKSGPDDYKKMKSRDKLYTYQRLCSFREMSVFPTVNDIFDKAPFIRSNIVEGAYENVEHYLDVQFRLLREDFISPLREGIEQFVRNRNGKIMKKQIGNLQIYENVVFGDWKDVNDQRGIIVHFKPPKQSKNVKWDDVERFMFGSLLCFTKNNFQDILFGSVLESEPEKLQNGKITVLLNHERELQKQTLEGSFIMAESEAYFDPYRLVMEALQRMSEANFPMYRYIIAVEKSRQPPLYLRKNPLATYRINQRAIRPLQRNSWPGEDALGLNKSQYEAFQAALTEEFVVIQGPPGTGKTFLALMVAKTLLQNSNVWNAGRNPILVVCYTNHALDQFLEGLLPDTKEIVRVGGRSKSDKLESFNLKEKKKFHCFDNIRNTRTTLGYDLCERLSKVNTKQMRDLDIMRQSLVVGMTTTCAARLQTLLQTLKPKIVIAEEAAEALESHIVVSLTKECEHVILIGDHQQLRPSTCTYKLAQQFHLDVSLFERMVKNGIGHHRLSVQHRMRPEIVRLIVPTIYPGLMNHYSVQKYEQVKGITKSLFFVSHTAEEEKVSDTSQQNVHEAEFLLHLCQYLLLQGYQPKDITILTTYKGQMFLIKKIQTKMEALHGVKITSVDNFQGEENKIILLSLVRSNKKAIIGFLKIENRVCVALSRAQEGLYIVGNMDNLSKSSTIWRQVKRSLEEQDCLGTALTLQCSIHPGQLTEVSAGSDFVKFSPEGGCSLICKGILKCGHHCVKVCHVNNRKHEGYKCYEKCKRFSPECPSRHPCTKVCFMDCGNCETMLEWTLPCGHKRVLHCYMYYNRHKYQHLNKCMEPCTKKNAGCTKDHFCAKLCHEKCSVCNIEMNKKLPCNHTQLVKCSENPGAVKCGRKCEKILPCGHKCPRLCFEVCGGCQQKVVKTINACGHKIVIKCSENPLHSMCKERCERILACGHNCTGSCNSPCSSVLCNALITSPVQPVCGHDVEIPCRLASTVTATSEVLLSYCRAPCWKILECEHICNGSCGQCLQGRVHIPCSQKCKHSLFCKHKRSGSCASACRPCGAKCQYQCLYHSGCRKECGEPCEPCMEPCGWYCEHNFCTNVCHEICDRDPCYKPCKEKLDCGHACIGFCGDPCPPLCRICNKDEVTEIFFGREYKKKARFVLLADCSHTLESKGLEQWLAQEGALKTCPKCKTSILKTQRFMNYVKRAYGDKMDVEQQIYNQQKSFDLQRQALVEKIKINIADIQELAQNEAFSNSLAIMEKFQRRLQTFRSFNNLGCGDLECLKEQVHILLDLQESMKKVYSQLNVATVKQTVVEHFNFLLDHLEKRVHISSQEAKDFNRECLRFLRIAQLAALECACSFETADVQQLYEDTKRALYSTEIHSSERDKEMKGKLEQMRQYLLAVERKKKINCFLFGCCLASIPFLFSWLNRK